MRSVQSIIFSNSLAIVLTIVCVLPITAVFVFSLTAPIDDAFANFGLWLHNKYEWSVATFVTELRFAKVGFALFATQMDNVISFADKKLNMPPKSTWFDPKPLDGLVAYDFE